MKAVRPVRAVHLIAAPARALTVRPALRPPNAPAATASILSAALLQLIAGIITAIIAREKIAAVALLIADVPAVPAVPPILPAIKLLMVVF